MKRVGPSVSRAAVELPVLVGLVMFGFVLCANAARYGAAGAIPGALLAGVGLVACRRRFRRSGDFESTREDRPQ